MRSKITIGLVAFLFAIGAFAPAVSAQETENTDSNASTIAALQEQIQQLLAQVQMLQEQLQQTQEAQNELQEEVEALRLERQLERGMSGEEVEELQEILATDSEIYPEGLTTGYFGPLTEAAVKRFQAKAGIAQVGRVGPQTLSRINQLLEEGAGNSGKVPPGLLIAPGIQKKLRGDDYQFVPPGLGGAKPDADKPEDPEDENEEEQEEETTDEEDEENTEEDQQEEEEEEENGTDEEENTQQ